MELILASNSPRRKALLTEYGFDFKVVPSAYEEQGVGATPQDTVKTFAFGKAKDIFDNLPNEKKSQSVVLGADTVVCLDGQILGKPKSKEDAKAMLNRLSNKEHLVYTGYCIISSDKVINDCVKSIVVFNKLSNALIEEYIATGKPLDKAGAYGIQDGFNLVKEYKGSFNNIVGLPIEIIKEQIKSALNKG